jgi:death-on-curing family protein
MRSLNIKEVEYIAFRLARECLSYNEPIPNFTTRPAGKPESCLAVPFQKFDKKHLYPGLIQRASALFYLIIKNHPFQNGNKRIAMTTLMALLHKNKKWLRVDTKVFYDFAMWIAQSPPDAKAETVIATEKFIKKYLIDLT